MNCDDYQRRICDRLDAGESSLREGVLEMHLASCPGCRAFHTAWAGLDAQLTRNTAPAALPEDFKTTLLTRLPAPRPRLTPAEVAALRAQYEREYRAAMALSPGYYLFLQPAKLLRLLAPAVGIAVAGFLMPDMLREVPGMIVARFGNDASRPTLWLLCIGLGLAAMLFGIHRAWRPIGQQLPRL